MTAASPPAPSLFVATPSADGIMLSGFVTALTRMLARLNANGIPACFQTLDGHDLPAQFDRLTEAFLASQSTHILYVDSDMVFPEDLAERLLACDKPFLGAAYAKRALDVGHLLLRLEGADADAFPHHLARSYAWTVRPLDAGIAVRGGLARVRAVGTGFLLVRRACFEAIAAAGVPRYATASGAPGRAGFFAEIRDGEAVLDCDYAFCRRWTDCGGEVWAFVEADIRHLGDLDHPLPFLTYLKALSGGQPSPEPDA